MDFAGSGGMAHRCSKWAQPAALVYKDYIRFLMVFVNLMRSTKISLSVSMSGSPSQKPNILKIHSWESVPKCRGENMTKLYGHYERKESGAWNLFSVGAAYFLQLAILSMSQVWVSSRVKCCPGRCRSAWTFKERDTEREREGEGKLDSVRLVSFCIRIWMYNDVHEYQYVYMCVWLFVYRVFM
jgi:hypothetical protein